LATYKCDLLLKDLILQLLQLLQLCKLELLLQKHLRVVGRLLSGYQGRLTLNALHCHKIPQNIHVQWHIRVGGRVHPMIEHARLQRRIIE
jgi:hypothetical protein